MTVTSRPDVLVVGGGLAGAATAIRLARLGREVLVAERTATPRWRACGVFTAAPGAAWLALGLDSAELGRLATPIPVFRLLARGGAIVPLTYGGTADAPVAHGFERPRLDARLLELAAGAGATLCLGTTVTSVQLGAGARSRPQVRLRTADGSMLEMEPAVVVGADGVRSMVARAIGITRRPRIGRRIAMTFHVAGGGDPGTTSAAVGSRDGWMVVIRGGYCGLAPVPGGRVNVGIVLDTASWAVPIRRDGAEVTARRILRSLPLPAGSKALVADDQPVDRIAGIVPVAHAVQRLAGDGWLLAGDAAGFLDPFTGEGIGRALTTSELAACAVDDALRGEKEALARYERDVRARFAARDRLSTLVQRFLARPRLFDYAARRIASRPTVRATLDLVLGEQVPASLALDPRFLGAVLRP